MAYGPTMNKGERDELRRLIRAQLKVLRADVNARSAELRTELQEQVKRQFEALDRAFDQATFRLKGVVDEANRRANDIGRELYGAEAWGVQTDREIIFARQIPKPGMEERTHAWTQGVRTIEERVAKARAELDRKEAELLTELALAALDSADAKAFLARIPTVTELVPAYRLPQLTERTE